MAGNSNRDAEFSGEKITDALQTESLYWKPQNGTFFQYRPQTGKGTVGR